MSNPTLELLAQRRSTKAIDMPVGGPSSDELGTILRAGMRVPDHAKLAPWEFLVFQGGARGRFGEVLKEAYSANNPDAAPSSLEAERSRFERANTVVAVLSKPKPAKFPAWEQHLSAGAACQNMMIAAASLGYACQWLTEWYAYDATIHAHLGLSDGQQIAGYLYFGGKAEFPADRDRPNYDAVVRFYE